MRKARRQIHARPPWERMMRFHNLIQSGEYPNCSTLAGEFEVTVRTIMRDVEFMKSRMDLPLEFDGERNGYYYSRPVEQFPQVPISEAEVFALLVAHKAIAQYHGTPFERPLTGGEAAESRVGVAASGLVSVALKLMVALVAGRMGFGMGDVVHVHDGGGGRREPGARSREST